MIPTIATNVKTHTRRSDSTRMTGFLVRLLGVGSSVDGAGTGTLPGGSGVSGILLMAGFVCANGGGGGGGIASVGERLSNFFCHSCTGGGKGVESARKTLSSLWSGIVSPFETASLRNNGP